ncbi:hypothetical protein A3B51_02960 [Candidatus Curtissbacteria bacterium RIFCSPLOWO2_01_FULL_41_18]|uniref:GIY-YIG domain-containing protein n=2 Tax=Candidatus Curtissiibacteriota TaxID=1752717 RepID=A0A1F5FYC7_9BACT|nr:MAG: hypothetical protein A2696_01475 [Candidatus Curtissbacteria bacterium RIFCSPHIGHO2_01_FULL_41_13]OGE05526.1 MAG: hypothetical protein A3B51_02960 [Candidatus Curtissbacteria bacterium RIFCSPLOWO2_01_FULL_41_18]
MRNRWKWYVYILELKNGLYYTGMTWKPVLRFDQHSLEEHEDFELARRREIQIKDFSRKKKRELINSFNGKFSLALEQ